MNDIRSDYMATIEKLRGNNPTLKKSSAVIQVRDERERQTQQHRMDFCSIVTTPTAFFFWFSARCMSACRYRFAASILELFTLEMLALLRLTCKMIFDVHHRGTVCTGCLSLDFTSLQHVDSLPDRTRLSLTPF